MSVAQLESTEPNMAFIKSSRERLQRSAGKIGIDNWAAYLNYNRLRIRCTFRNIEKKGIIDLQNSVELIEWYDKIMRWNLQNYSYTKRYQYPARVIQGERKCFSKLHRS